MTAIDLTSDDLIRGAREKDFLPKTFLVHLRKRFEGQSDDDLRRYYNELAGRHGCRIMGRKDFRSRDRFLEFIWDLEELIKAGHYKRVMSVQPCETWDGVARKAPMPKGE